MTQKITYKKQGSGIDSWRIEEYESDQLIRCYMVYEKPEGWFFDDDIEASKLFTCNKIDETTSFSLLNGITYKDIILSFSEHAQIDYLGIRETPTDEFPIPILSLDEKSVVLIENQNDANDLYTIAWKHRASIKKAGGALKLQVNSMTNINDIINFIDPRI